MERPTLHLVAIAAIVLSLVACGDDPVSSSPQAGASVPDAFVGVDSGEFGDECFDSFDCGLDTVCRQGYCVEVECLVGGEESNCRDGEACVYPTLVIPHTEEEQQRRADERPICSQAPGCDFDFTDNCDPKVGRPYCNTGLFDPPRPDCPGPGTRFWACQ